MKQTIRTLALTEPETRLLASLLRSYLPAAVHLIVTSGLEERKKTEMLCETIDNYHTLQSMIRWKDDDVIRAYRQTSLEGIMALKAVLSRTIFEELSPGVQQMFTAHGKGLIDAVYKALEVSSDIPLLRPVPIANPKSKA